MAGIIITIGGLPGSGKSTLGKLLAARLGVPFYSMGRVWREYASEHGIGFEELHFQAETDPSIDERIDRYQQELPRQHPSFVIDSRLGHHFIPQAIKIFLKADLRTCAERILHADRAEQRPQTIEESLATLRHVIDSNRKRYLVLYGTDMLDEAQYDLVLDSERTDPFALLAQVLAELRRRGIPLPDTAASKAI